jgi:hypothetical protein
MVHRYTGHVSRLLPLLLVIAAASPASAENGSLRFDGADDYVNVPEPVDLLGPLTLEVWVKVDAGPGGGRIVSNRDGNNGYELDTYGSDDVYTLRYIFNGSVAIDADFTPYIGVWTHVAALWAGPPNGVASIYINGTLQASWAHLIPINSATGPLRIGAAGGGGYNYRGYIDEVRIWSTALDGATIASWMSRPLAADHPDYADIEAYWNFDEGSGQVLDNLTGDARRDGELGSGSGQDDSDPQWESEGAPVPVAPATIGQIKQLFLKQ